MSCMRGIEGSCLHQIWTILNSCHLPATSGSSKNSGHQMTRGFMEQRHAMLRCFEARAQWSPQIQAQVARAVCMATCQLHRHIRFTSGAMIGSPKFVGFLFGEFPSAWVPKPQCLCSILPDWLHVNDWLIRITPTYPDWQWWHDVAMLHPARLGKVRNPCKQFPCRNKMAGRDGKRRPFSNLQWLTRQA